MSERLTLVPEPEVKRRLAEFGVAIPNGVVSDTLPDASGLRAPLVLKAFGPGIVHKTDIGAVRLGLAHDALPVAAAAMQARLRPAGFLVEEQCDTDDGVEVIVGVTRRDPFGLVVALGMGGTATEVLDLVEIALFPLSARDGADLVDRFPGTAALEGLRGGPALDRDALVDVLLAVAGADGLARRYGDELQELECNPVLVTPSGAIALDARLVVREAHAAHDDAPATDFTRLFAPRAVAVAGASTTRSGFGNRALAAYRAAGWNENLYALHPEAASVDGVPAIADVGDIDDTVDYLLVAVPAARCADVVRATNGRVPFVQVISGGFDEVGDDGVGLSRDLLSAARDAKTRVIGPNCIGVYSPEGRQTFMLDAPPDAGTVSVLSQSGGLSGDIVRLGARTGVQFSKLASIGNAVDVTAAELLDWLVDDPDTSIVGLYLEGASGAERLVASLRRARSRTPVALLVGGLSEQGAVAAASHTGALATDARVWAAVARSTGAVIVPTLEQLVGVLAYVQRWLGAHGSDADDVLVIGPGGGASVLATDACDRAGLRLTPTSSAAREMLHRLGLGAGTSVANPLEIPFGPAVPVDALRAVLLPILDEQPYSDVLVHLNVSAYYGYGTEGVAPLVAQLRDLATAALGNARVAVVLRNVAVASSNDADALLNAAREHRLVTFSTLDDAAVAISAMQTFGRQRQGAS